MMRLPVRTCFKEGFLIYSWFSSNLTRVQNKNQNQDQLTVRLDPSHRTEDPGGIGLGDPGLIDPMS